VKRQFVPLTPSQGKGEPPEQASLLDNWLTGSDSSNAPSAQPPQATFPHVTIRPVGSRLLSGWKSNRVQQANHAGEPLEAPLADQETLKQHAIQGPLSSLSLPADLSQNFATGQVSPHQSDITPLSTLFPGAQTYPSFGSPIHQSSGFQPLQSAADFSSQPLQSLYVAPPTEQHAANRQTVGLRKDTPPLIQPPPGQGPGGKVSKKKRRFPIWVRVAIAMLTVLIVVVGCGIYYYEANFAAPLNNITGQTATRVKGDDNPYLGRDSTGGDILSGGRFNILLLGSDDDYKTVHINGGVLAQTDIVVSVDPATKSVSMLSIPRDSWVNVPGYGMHKLDQAYLLGGGGPNGAALSMATIHQDFGIYIDHYAWVGLTGFTKVIHTVGGVDVDVLHPITDDSYPDDSTLGALDPYAVERLYIAPGPQHLSDLQALEYVRSRHADLVGDFGRSVRQQQILNQLKYKLDNPSIFGQLPVLAQDLNGYVKTDMQLADVFKLMNFARSLDQSKIQRVTLGPPYSTDQQMNTDAGNQDVVILNCAKVQPLIANMFALGNNARCDQVSSGNSSPTASTPSASAQIGLNVETDAANPWRTASQIANISTMSLAGSNSDFMGVHSLLDLLFLVVFESPVALQF